MMRFLATLAALPLVACATGGGSGAPGDTAAMVEPAGPPAAVATAQLARIAALDDAGPRLNAVIAINQQAPDQARAAAAAGLPLAGRTVLVKDNIETREWPTTAGSLALADNRTGRDAPLIVRLRDRVVWRLTAV